MFVAWNNKRQAYVLPLGTDADQTEPSSPTPPGTPEAWLRKPGTGYCRSESHAAKTETQTAKA